ncbi:MAG TPA: flagellar hook-basal body complex protein FliE [Casimicrobiaceae bacterium]|nr:flagellar hook-basal body complex protein FliE [Casimicrobiaceae bacterium]
MAIESISMDALLAKLEAARAALSRMPASAPNATPGAPGAPGAAKPVDFGQILKDSIAKVNDSQGEAMGLAERFQLGDSKVTLEETMVALSKANISFQQMVQVRNRVITAYHDIMNLQI